MAIINGDELGNMLIGTNEADIIEGLDGNDVLSGLAGHDLLNGGTGADIMIGGSGNDLYIVDNPRDIVVELRHDGMDRVQSSVSFSLHVPGAFNVENLTLGGNAEINGFGNALNNFIVGNDAHNALYGRAGHDALFGFGGDDYMEGGTGSDTLNGGTGADIMHGGDGNDTYVVDNFRDVVIELPSEGNDKIVSSVNVDLTVGYLVNVENLTLAGAAPLNGTGNARSNTIVGNEEANVLTGLDGSDHLLGRGGDDLINGGAGNDSILTGSGHDRIVFDALGSHNIDAVQDFNPSLDTLLLQSAVFTALAPGALAAGALVIGTAAADANDHIIYDSSNGLLSYDADGVGGAAQTEFAVLQGGLHLTNSDFVVI